MNVQDQMGGNNLQKSSSSISNISFFKQLPNVSHNHLQLSSKKSHLLFRYPSKSFHSVRFDAAFLFFGLVVLGATVV